MPVQAQNAELVQVRGFCPGTGQNRACRLLEAGSPPMSRPEGNRQQTPRRFRAEGLALRYHALTRKLAHAPASQMAGVLIRIR